MTMPRLDLAKTVALAELLRLAPRSWKRLYVDYEMQPVEDVEFEMVCSPVAFAVVKPLFGPIRRVDLDVSGVFEVGDALKNVGRLAMAAERRRCVTLELIVRSRSDAEWSFDYSPPPRVTATRRGDLTAQFRDPSMNKRYRKHAARDEWLAQIS